MDVKCPLPDFASALASASANALASSACSMAPSSANTMAPYYHPVPSPADSGACSMAPYHHPVPSPVDSGALAPSNNANSMAPYPVPSPADSGVMSPMTPMSNYTQGSTPEQHYHVACSPEHLCYGINNPTSSDTNPDTNNIQISSSSSGEYNNHNPVPSSPYPASVHSDEGVVIPKCHPCYDSYDHPYYVSTVILFWITYPI